MKTKNVLRGISIAVALLLEVLAGSAQTNIYLYTGSETNITLNQGTYIITAYGAQGGYGEGGGGGLGAEMEGQFNFAGVTTLTILVGGAGVGATYNSGGGGGGSFVVNGSTPLVIAGAGGGGGIYTGGTGSAGGVGGSNGSGGVGGYAAGGGGFYTSGTNGNGSYGSGGGSFLSGGAGGSGGTGGNSPNFGYSGSGGYGGGGGGGYFGGGGGGYSGGGGGGYSGGGGGGGAYFSGGGGGGSIIDSSAITNLAEVSGIASPDDSPNGEIIITVISAVSAPTLTNIVISPTNPVIVVGTNETFAATGYFSNSSVGSLNSANGLVWSSSNPGVATINTSGVATGLTVGTATITATDSSVSNNTTLTVNMTTPTITNTPPVFQSVTQSGATLTLTWSAVIGQAYIVEYKNTLNQPNWNILGLEIVATNSIAMLSVIIDPAFPKKFYRVVELLDTGVNLQPSVATITSPIANQQLSNAVFSVSGTASGINPVVAVFYQLNSQPWTAATTTNGWTNWTANVTLISGTNTVHAYALDTSGKISATNSISFRYYTPQDLPTLLLTEPLPHGQVGQFYNQSVGQGTGGTPPYYFSLETAGGFPLIGIIMDLNGNLSGTPSVAGTYNFGVCVVDLVGAQDCETATLVVDSVYQLNIVETGTGTGMVTANPPDLSYTNGTVVTLTATPDSGSTFTGWSGAASGAASSVQVTINGNTSVTAEFDNPDAVWNGTWNSTQSFVSSDGTCSQNVTASISLVLSVSGGVVSGSGTENGIPCFNYDCSVDSYPTITGPVSGSVSGNTISVNFSGVANGGACDGQSVDTSFTATMINSTTLSGTTPSGRAFTYTKQ